MRDKKLTITLELLPIGTKVSKPIMEEGGMTTYTLKQPYIAINSTKSPKQQHLVPIASIQELLAHGALVNNEVFITMVIENILE